MENNVDDLGTEVDDKVGNLALGLMEDKRRWGVILKLNLPRREDRFITVFVTEGESKGEPVEVALTAIRYNPKEGNVKIHGRYKAPKNNGNGTKLRRMHFLAETFRPGDLPKFVEQGILLVTPTTSVATAA